MLLIYTFLIVFGIANCAELPSVIQKCKAEDYPCIIKVTNEVIKNYAGGNTDEGFPSVDPFTIKAADLNIPPGSVFDINMKVNDVVITGMSGLVIDRAVGFSKDPLTSKFEMYGTIPQLAFNGGYSGDGKILLMQFKGDGQFQVILKNVKVSVIATPTAIKKDDGLTYLQLDSFKVTMEPENAEIQFKNLFGGNDLLGKTMNNLLNASWKTLWKDFAPIAYNGAEFFAKQVSAGLLNKYNYEALYLE